MLYSILFGALGGFVRALVGVAKYFKRSRSRQKVRCGYSAYTILLAAAVGGIAGVFANGDWKFAIVVGYAGTDFLEGLYHVKKAQKFEV